jgi:lipopolysaccharide export system protein LptA
MNRRGVAIAAILTAFAAFGSWASAQGLDFASQNGLPVEVYADNGMELSQDAKTVIARGNAKAIRGRVTVTADVLTAHYRDKPKPGAAGAGTVPKPSTAETKTASAEAKPAAAGKGAEDSTTGNSEIWRLEADGHVVIFTETQHAYGDHADYNIDDAVVVLTGKDLHMTTTNELVTARDSLEYWEKRQQAVARGNATATKEDKRIRADVLVADYGQDQDKKTVLRHATGFNHVVITTPTEIVTGNRTDYDPLSGIVTVTGAVKMTRGQNQLDGEYAVVNLNTGISRVFPNAPGATANADSRVKALLIPQHGNGDGASGAPSGPATAITAAPPPPPTPPASQ